MCTLEILNRSSVYDLGSVPSLLESWGTVSLALIKTIPQHYLLRVPPRKPFPEVTGSKSDETVYSVKYYAAILHDGWVKNLIEQTALQAALDV